MFRSRLSCQSRRQPELFFKTQRQESKLLNSALLHDLEMAAATVNRAQRRLAGAAESDARQCESARRQIDRIERQLQRIGEQLEPEQETQVEPKSTHDDPGTGRPTTQHCHVRKHTSIIGNANCHDILSEGPEMKLACLILSFGLAAVVACNAEVTPGRDPARRQVLVLTGYNSTSNHDWRTYVPKLRQTLHDSGLFEVRVNEEPAGITEATLAGYDLILLDYSTYIPSRAPDWPQVTRLAYLGFLRKGHGVVALHAACGSFQDWAEYRQTLGIVDHRRIGHGPYHTFTVEVRYPHHPAVSGIPPRFEMWGEIYNGIQLGPEAEVLAAAFDNPANCSSPGRNCGSGKQEPILWTARYGTGRTFVLTLGHDLRSIGTPTFQQLLIKACQWAAGPGSNAHISPRP